MNERTDNLVLEQLRLIRDDIRRVEGTLGEKIDDLEQAAEFYQLSLALDPKDDECLTNFIELLCETDLVDAKEFIESFIEANPGMLIAQVLKVNVLWLFGRKEEAMILFAKCCEQDKKIAQEIFDINPSLKKVQEFLDLSEE